MSAKKKLLITGSTGKQGGAVIHALLSNPFTASSFEILALTRNASSAKAQSLASKPGITIVQGDPSSPEPIFAQHAPIHGIFIVTIPGGTGEEAQALPLITQAAESGVGHIVLTSVDRGGPGRSDENPTQVPHFATKHRIEQFLKEKSSESKDLQWTILRPSVFMDNLVPGFQGKVFASMWAGVGDKPLQFVSVHDIGVFAARAFVDPKIYAGRAISLAGDEMNIARGKEVFKETLGYEMPETFGFVGAAIKWMIREVGTMFAWFEEEGYAADIEALRKEEPKLQDFGAWLRESSQFEKKSVN